MKIIGNIIAVLFLLFAILMFLFGMSHLLMAADTSYSGADANNLLDAMLGTGYILGAFFIMMIVQIGMGVNPYRVEQIGEDVQGVKNALSRLIVLTQQNQRTKPKQE